MGKRRSAFVSGTLNDKRRAFMTTSTLSDSECACSTGQTEAELPCPGCEQLGRTVSLVTPMHTVKSAIRDQIVAQRRYHFCTNPDCDVVYYNDHDTSTIGTDGLKNRVTIKDNSAETPLCYCFKVLKKHAIEEIQRTGTTDVFQTIQAKMKPGQSCFCEKANPRGDTCTQDILQWLSEQGIEAGSSAQGGAGCGGCGADDAAGISGGGCCG